MHQWIQNLIGLGRIAVLVGLWVLGNVLVTHPAIAAIRQLEESPGQIVYQSRQSLEDQHGHRWQAIAFNRVRPDGSTSFFVRLVTFPGNGEIDRSQPLTLTDSLGHSLTAQDASAQIFTDETAPEPNVGQYDLKPIVTELPDAMPIQLALPLVEGDRALLFASPSLVQEWKTVAAYR